MFAFCAGMQFGQKIVDMLWLYGQKDRARLFEDGGVVCRGSYVIPPFCCGSPLGIDIAGNNVGSWYDALLCEGGDCSLGYVTATDETYLH